ncbi:MAG: anthranilate phosphoribosyltransferase [Polyangiales bacterium]
MIGEIIERVVNRQDLAPVDMEAALDQILAGNVSEAQIAAFVVALRMKGETVDEIAAAARAMRSRCTPIRPRVEGPLLDTCGTGGDGLQTFNISTASAIVVAAAGVSVAKHGNRAATSKAGSADVLEALGVRIDLEPDRVQASIEQVGIGFLFAQAHHAALRHAAPVRRQLVGRTIFNMLGPLSNPAGATHQLIGVYAGAPIERLARALGELGLERAWVVRGDDGLDEVSPQGRTVIAQWDGGDVSLTSLTPDAFGLEPVAVESLRGGDAAENAAIIRDVLEGKPGAPRTAILINAAAGLCVAGVETDPERAARRVADAIDSGDAQRLLARWAEFSESP